MNTSNGYSADKSSDPLDRLLEEAQWPAPDPQALARLERQWELLSAARSRRRRWLWAAAACLMLGTLGWWLRPREAGPEQVAPVDPRPRPEPQLVRDAPLRESSPDDVPAPTIPPLQQPSLDQTETIAGSRDANAYEKLVFAAAQRRNRSEAPPDVHPVDEIVDELLALQAAGQVLPASGLLGGTVPIGAALARGTDPALLAQSLSAPLASQRALVERTLLRRLPQYETARRRAAIHLLAHVGGPRSVPALVAWSRHEATHGAAVRALARLADPLTIAQLAEVEPEQQLQQELFAALLSRRESGAVALYLSFLGRAATKEAALAAVKQTPDPPVALLFHFLDSPHHAQRLAAAVALGRLEDPAVVGRLRAMVLRDVKRQEALVALLASTGEEATSLVAQARRSPSLVAALNAAQVQLEFVSP